MTKFKHPPSPIVFKDNCFQYKKTKLRGLLPTLKQRYYNRYKYELAKLRDRNAKEGVQGKKKKQYRILYNSKEHGILFDEQIRRTVNVYLKYEVSFDFFTDSKIRISTKNVPTYAKSQCAGLMPYVIKFWQLLFQLDLVPVAAQVPVGYIPARVGTACDVVCKNKQGQIVVVETKCGFENYYWNCTEYLMTKPLNNFTDCPANQHLLQVHYTNLMYQNTFPNIPVASPMVFRFHPSGVDVRFVDPAIIEHASLDLLKDSN